LTDGFDSADAAPYSRRFGAWIDHTCLKGAMNQMITVGRYKYRTRSQLRVRGFVISFLIMILTFAGQINAENILTRGSGREARTLDPHFAFGSAASEILHDMFEGLFVLSNDGEPILGSAKSYSVSEDGLTYTFILRDDLQWSDGTPLTAEDFAFSLLRLADPATASPLAGNAFPIKNARAINSGELPPDRLGVTAVDDLTLTIELEQAVSFLPKLMLSTALVPMPEHVIREHGKKWARADHIVSNGAYKLTEWRLHESIVLTRNEEYYGAEFATIDKVIYYPVEKEEQGFLRYRAGEIDVLRGFPLARLDYIRKNLSDDMLIHPYMQATFILFNLEEAPYNDVNVRKALSIALDREKITSKLLRDGSIPAYSLVMPLLPEYGSNLPEYSKLSLQARQDEARILLKNSGYTADAPLQVSFTYGAFERFRPTAIAVQSMWQDIGVDVELVAVGPQSYVRTMMAGEFSLMLVNDVPRADDPTAIMEILRLDSPQNFSHYKNREFESLVIGSLGMKNLQQRYEVLKKAESLAMAEYPTIPVYFNAQRILINPRVKGWLIRLRGPNYSRNLSITE